MRISQKLPALQVGFSISACIITGDEERARNEHIQQERQLSGKREYLASEKANEQEQQRKDAETRSGKMNALTSDFDRLATEVLNAVSEASQERHNTARSMSGLADENAHQATVVASASEQTSINVQIVATASEQMASVIAEIVTNSQQAAIGTQEVSTNIITVNDTASKTGKPTQRVVHAAADLGEQSDNLNNAVKTLLKEVKTV